MRRFTLAELRVADTDSDSDASPPPQRTELPRNHKVSVPEATTDVPIPSAPPPHVVSAPPVPDVSSSPLGASSGFVLEMDESIPTHSRGGHTQVLVPDATGGDAMEGREGAVAAPSASQTPLTEPPLVVGNSSVGSADIPLEGAHNDVRRSLSPPIRHPRHAWASREQEEDSDIESVQFVEVAGTRDASREQSAKACALVLDDGQEVTPDSFASHDSDSDASTRQPDVNVIRVAPSDAGRAPTHRGESIHTGRVTARSGSAIEMSLYRQRLVERHQAEERRLQVEIALQWKDLTFRPQIGDRDDNFHIQHSQPYYVRLHADSAKARERRKSGTREASQRTSRPVLSAKTQEMMGYRRGDVFERLHRDKPAPEAPKKIVTCGTSAVFERLLASSGPVVFSDDPSAAECTFKPKITDVASKLSRKRGVVERLYHVPKRHQPSEAAL